MRHRMVVFLSACVMASAAAAQTTQPASNKGDSWAKPASASSAITYRSEALPADKSSTSPFKFKSKDGERHADQLPPSPNDKASVMGKERPWQNGQAPVNCAESPHSAGC